MTDPADLDSLLSWTNQKLGIHYGKAEADFEHFSFDPRELPALPSPGTIRSPSPRTSAIRWPVTSWTGE